MGMDTKHDEDDAQNIPIDKLHETPVDPGNVSSDNLKDTFIADDDTTLSAEYDKLITESETQNTAQQEPSPASLKIVPIEEPKSSFNLHKYFLYTLVGGLIISALISVIAVLTGEFSSTMSRALGTTGSMVVHTFILLFLLSIGNNDKNGGQSFTINTLVLITVVSFITSTLGIWEIISGRATADTYLLLFYTFLASLWTQLLLKVGENLIDKPTRIVSKISIGFTALFYIILIPTIFTHYPDKLPEFHYRVLAATAIVLATTSVLTTVFRRIYIFKHHGVKMYSTSTSWDIVIACIVLFAGLPIMFSIIASLSMYNNDYNSYNSESNRISVSKKPTARITPSPSPDKAYTYDSGAVSAASDNNFNTAKECIKVSDQNIPDSKIQTFNSLDVKYGRIVTKPLLYQGSSTSSTPFYGQTIFVDKNCVKIDVSTLQLGDELYYYYSFNPDNSPKYKLSFVQKIR